MGTDEMAKTCGEDICLWPDDTWCHAEDLEEHLRFKSDDFERIPFDTPRWHALVEE
jgi:hypothetical protein